MIRTINFTTVNAKAVRVVDGEIQSIDLKPINYTGRKQSDIALKKQFREQLEDNSLYSEIVITNVEELSKKFEVSLDDFLKIAKEVEDDREEE